jgi:cyclase
MLIAHNVYAVLNMFHPVCGVNAGFIVTEKHIVYVDAGWTIPNAQTILGYSLAVAPNNEPKCLIFTDHHLDHISGMKAFKEAGVKTVGHVNLDKLLRDNNATRKWRESINSLYDRWFSELYSKDKSWREHLFGDVELSPLDQTIDKDTVIKVDNEKIHVLCTPGHWKASLSVYLPASRVLFAGDTIFSGFEPTTRFGDKNLWQQWINSLEKLSNLDISYIIPGHGRICDTEEIPRHIKYLKGLTAKT